MSTAVQGSAVSIYLSCHGSEMCNPSKKQTRADNPIKYTSIDVNCLIVSGSGNVHTEVGVVVEPKRRKCYSDLVTKPLIAHLKEYCRSNEFGTLTYLIPHIYGDDPSFYGPYDSASSSRKLKTMLEEMLCLGTHSDINYPKSSLPEIVPNPHFNKKYFFGFNPHERDRRSETHGKTGVLMRSNPARQCGDPDQNTVFTYPGLYITATTNVLHKPFSLSDILGKDAHDLVPIEEIKKRNLLTKHNYLLFWRGHIESLDFSDFPDEDVLDIGDIFSAIHIFKQLAYVFGTSITDAEADAEEMMINELPNDDGSQTMHSTQSHSSGHLLRFKELLISLKSLEIEEKSKLVQEAEQHVQSARKEFSEKADFADHLEEMINELKKEIQRDEGKIEQIKTEITDKTAQLETMTLKLQHKTAQLETLKAELEVMILELADADEVYKEKRTILQTEKARHASLIDALDRVKNDLHEQIKQFIASILMTDNEELKSIIKNLIMMNKLKNILKTGILYKKLSLRQIVTFFRGVRYEILDIIDPSCFKVQIEQTPVVNTDTQIDTQEIPKTSEESDDSRRQSVTGDWTKSLLSKDSKGSNGPKGPNKRLKQGGGARNRNSSIRRTRKRNNNGGKTRKSKYSRKHRSHRKGGSTRQRKRR